MIIFNNNERETKDPRNSEKPKQEKYKEEYERHIKVKKGENHEGGQRRK